MSNMLEDTEQVRRQFGDSFVHGGHPNGIIRSQSGFFGLIFLILFGCLAVSK